MKTYSPKASEVHRDWHIIDASGKTLGKLATEAATLLRGKHKPMYSPHFDTGDFVGFRSTTFAKMMETHPTRPVEKAIRGMLPHNSLGRAMFRRLKVYPSETHPHQSQVGKAEVKGAE
jgi:large subunit ribosomal protein L13